MPAANPLQQNRLRRPLRGSVARTQEVGRLRRRRRSILRRQERAQITNSRRPAGRCEYKTVQFDYLTQGEIAHQARRRWMLSFMGALYRGGALSNEALERPGLNSCADVAAAPAHRRPFSER